MSSNINTHIALVDTLVIDDYAMVDLPSIPTSTASSLTEDADPLLLSASTVLPGGQNNKKKPKSVAFGPDTAPGDEPSADAFALGLLRIDAAAGDSRDETVRHLLSNHQWPAMPASTATGQKAERGSSERSSTEASFVLVHPVDHKTDPDVAGAGGWADSATHPDNLEISDSDSE